MQIITVDESKCVGCNACVRVCPVHANTTRIKDGTTDEFITGIVPEACINCGECVKACNHHARDYKDDFEEFRRRFESKEKMILIVAPAIRTSFPFGDWKSVLSWLRKEGNVEIYDVGYGADICTFMHNKYMEMHQGKKIITQPCPAVVNYMEKYKPNLLKNLSPVMSPVGCLAVWLKKYKHKNEPMFMLSPCIAKTSEARREKSFDFNVTFKSLEDYLKKKRVSIEYKQSFDFDALEGGIGRMYPMPGGLKATMQMLNTGLVIRNAEGPTTVYDAIARYSTTEEDRRPDILDVLNCQYGCNHGTAPAGGVANLAEVEQIMDDITAKSIKENQGGFLGIGKMKRFKEFEKTLDFDDFLVSYSDKSIHRKIPTIDEINEVFNSMYKTTLESHSVNCGACGYKNCNEMAYAIYQGLNVKENCVYYLKQSLKDNYSKLKSMYDTCLKELQKIADISVHIDNAHNNVINNSSDINSKATELYHNLERLKKFSENCAMYFKNKSISTLTADDFNKIQIFINTISEMSDTFITMSGSFEKDSGSIKISADELSISVKELVGISNSMKNLIKG